MELYVYDDRSEIAVENYCNFIWTSLRSIDPEAEELDNSCMETFSLTYNGDEVWVCIHPFTSNDIHGKYVTTFGLQVTYKPYWLWHEGDDMEVMDVSIEVLDGPQDLTRFIKNLLIEMKRYSRIGRVREA